ncbi:MAG: hypothetical protein WAW02_00845 [Sideroxyarcus sp.]
MCLKEHPQVATRYAVSAHLLAGLLSTIVLTGCLSSTPIVADDPHVFLPSLRVAVSLDEDKQEADKQAASEPRTGYAIEFEYARAKGHGEQTLATGESPVNYTGTTFTAPNQLRNDFSFNYADVSFRWRKFFKERSLGLEVRGGIGHASMDLTVASSTQRASDHFGNYGPQGGVGLIWRMRPDTSLNARLSGFVSSSEYGVKSLMRYELFVAQALGDNLELRAGYAKWGINGDAGISESNFKSNFSGPMLDIGLNF